MAQNSKPVSARKKAPPRPHKSGDKKTDAQSDLERMLAEKLGPVIDQGILLGFSLLTQFLTKKIGGTDPSRLDSGPRSR